MCATMRSGSSAACSESSLRRPAQVGLPGQAGLARNACTAAVAALSTLLHIATDPAELPCTPDSGAPAVPAGGAARMPLLHVEGGHQRAAARGRGVAAGGGGGDQGGARACGGTGGARGGVGSGGVGCKCWAVVLTRWCARHCVAVSCVLCCMVWWWRTAACIWCILQVVGSSCALASGVQEGGEGHLGGGQQVRTGSRRGQCCCRALQLSVLQCGLVPTSISPPCLPSYLPLKLPRCRRCCTRWRTLRGAWCTSSPPTPPPRSAWASCCAAAPARTARGPCLRRCADSWSRCARIRREYSCFVVYRAACRVAGSCFPLLLCGPHPQLALLPCLLFPAAAAACHG